MPPRVVIFAMPTFLHFLLLQATLSADASLN